MKAQTQIIAHRGYWQTQPPTTENSLKSLENAQNLKIYGSEFDVRMTKRRSFGGKPRRTSR
jgi:glycerophosphoryl diester phosphodiesterase